MHLALLNIYSNEAQAVLTVAVSQEYEDEGSEGC